MFEEMRLYIQVTKLLPGGSGLCCLLVLFSYLVLLTTTIGEKFNYLNYTTRHCCTELNRSTLHHLDLITKTIVHQDNRPGPLLLVKCDKMTVVLGKSV